jgi:aminopeptidase N
MAVRYLDGLAAAQIGFKFRNRKDNTGIYAYFKSMYRPEKSDIYYLIYRNEWTPQQWNNTLNIGLNRDYEYKKGEGHINLHMRTSGAGSDYNFSQISLTVVNYNQLGKFRFNTRFFAQIGTGSNLASESALYLAGANPESMMDNKFTRSVGFFPQDWNGFGTTTNHFQAGGGLNLRGYAGYLAPFQRADGTIVPVYKGNSGAAVNAELEFDRFFPIRPKFTRKWLKINTYLFADAGFLQSNLPGEKMAFATPRADAGIGTAFTIKKWGPLNMEKPITVRFDMPLFLSRTPDVAPDYVQFRWVVGVNRAF